MMEPNPPHIPTPVPRPAPAQASSYPSYGSPQSDYPQRSIPPSPNIPQSYPSGHSSAGSVSQASISGGDQVCAHQHTPAAPPAAAVSPSGSVRPSDGSAYDSGRNLDKIRELIFGDELRYFEKRLNQIESSLTHEINQLKTLFDEHFKSLDRATMILAEQTRDRLESLTAQAQQEQARIGEQIREHHNSLYDMLAKATNDLRAEKADRRVIAEMFAEMSKRILNHGSSMNHGSRYETNMP
jgi:hypothetical protein